MSAKRRAIRKWSKTIEKILHAPPFSWPLNSARAYSIAMREGFYQDGYDPVDALNEDRSYWDD